MERAGQGKMSGVADRQEFDTKYSPRYYVEREAWEWNTVGAGHLTQELIEKQTSSTL